MLDGVVPTVLAEVVHRARVAAVAVALLMELVAGFLGVLSAVLALVAGARMVIPTAIPCRQH